MAYIYTVTIRSRNSSVGIATGYRLGSRGSIPGKSKIFFLPHSVQTGPGAHQVSYTLGAFSQR
jgi:hypothetical protein